MIKVDVDMKATRDVERFCRKYPQALAALEEGVLAEERGWRELSVPAMSLIVFRHEVLMEFSRESLEFIAQAKRGKAP